MTTHIFITCPHRSGGSLLSRMLCAHSGIFVHYSSIKFFTFCYNRYQPIERSENLKRMLDDVAVRVWSRYNLKIDTAGCLGRIETLKPTYADIASVLWNYDIASKKRIFGEVEASKWRAIPDFLKIFPHGKAILIIRDLRDVVNSFKRYTIAPGNDYLTALFNVIDAMDHYQRYMDEYPGRFHGLRYEDLKADPEKELKRVCRFLEIEFEEAMLDEKQWVDQSGRKRWDHGKDTSFQERELKDPVGRWRKMISGEDLFLCEWIGREQMRRFGIKPEARKVSQDVFDRAIGMITSSPILRDSFRNWCETGGGDDKYPLDPTNPANWDLKECEDPEAVLRTVKDHR